MTKHPRSVPRRTYLFWSGVALVLITCAAWALDPERGFPSAAILGATGTAVFLALVAVISRTG